MKKSERKVFGNLSTIIKISMLAVIAVILMQFEFPLAILFPDFLKIDLSDVPVLFGGFALGPVAGVLILLLKNLLHGLLMTKTAFVGEVANFTIGVFLVMIASYVYGNKKNRKSAIVGLLMGTIAMSIAAAILNYFFFIPAYAKLFNAPIDAFVGMAHKINGNITSFKDLIIWSIIPFNILKGSMVSVVTLGLYKKVSPILHKENMLNNNEEFINKKI